MVSKLVRIPIAVIALSSDSSESRRFLKVKACKGKKNVFEITKGNFQWKYGRLLIVVLSKMLRYCTCINRKAAWVCLCCDRNMNGIISSRKMLSGNTRRTRVSSGIFPTEMASWMFLSDNRNTKAIFHLFYIIAKVFSSFRDVIHVSVLWYNKSFRKTHITL